MPLSAELLALLISAAARADVPPTDAAEPPAEEASPSPAPEVDEDAEEGEVVPEPPPDDCLECGMG